MDITWKKWQCKINVCHVLRREQTLKLLGEDLKPVDSHLSSFTRDAKIENNYRILNNSKRTFKSLNVIYNKLCFYLRLCSGM